jgi:hypothetical protein
MLAWLAAASKDGGPDRSRRACRRLRSVALAAIVSIPVMPAIAPMMPVVVPVIAAAVAIRAGHDRPIGGIEAHFGPHALVVDQISLAAAPLQLDFSHRVALRHELGGEVLG